MAKFFQAVIIALALHPLVFTEAGAKESYCRVALERCIAQCQQFPALFRDGCSAGCTLMYLSCE